MEEEEIKPDTSSGGKVEGQETEESDIDSEVEFDNEFIEEFCNNIGMPRPMTISKELFYSDEMVTKKYEKLSDEDNARFNQMKDMAKAIKGDMGDYSLIEDLMAQVVAQHFGQMKKDVASMMGKEGEGVEGGKALDQVGGRLQIKKEPNAEPNKAIVTAIVPAEEASLIPYHIIEDEDRSDCIALGSEDSDVEEINKVKVRDILKNLANLKRQEAECLDKLSEAVPNMRDSDVTVLAEKVHGGELPKYVQAMYQRIGKPRNFEVALAAGERLLTLYLKNHPCLVHLLRHGKNKVTQSTEVSQIQD